MRKRRPAPVSDPGYSFNLDNNILLDPYKDFKRVPDTPKKVKGEQIVELHKRLDQCVTFDDLRRIIDELKSQIRKDMTDLANGNHCKLEGEGSGHFGLHY